jgi:hypothetical protein
MGYKEMDKVWRESQAVKTDKLILLAIAKTYNIGKGSWPSQKHLADLCGISDRAVRSGLNRLLKLGELVWIKGNSHGKANCYLISFLEKNVQETSAVDEQKLPLNVQETSAESDKNFRLLNKGLNKLDNKPKLVFSSVPGSEFWDVIAERRPDLSFVERREFLEFFETSRDGRWWIDNAHTDSKLVDACLACFPSAKGEINDK